MGFSQAMWPWHINKVFIYLIYYLSVFNYYYCHWREHLQSSLHCEEMSKFDWVLEPPINIVVGLTSYSCMSLKCPRTFKTTLILSATIFYLILLLGYQRQLAFLHWSHTHQRYWKLMYTSMFWEFACGPLTGRYLEPCPSTEKALITWLWRWRFLKLLKH